MPIPDHRYFKQSLKFFLLLVFIIADCSVILGAPTTASAKVQVGVLLDIKSETTDRFVANLREEVTALLGNQYAIRLPESKRYIANWSSESVLANYRVLLDDPEVDIIVAVGALSSAILAQQTSFQKPLILLGVLDYELQQIPLTADKKSGVHNLTYVLESSQFDADLDAFYSIFPYRNLAIIADQKLTE
ncbi:MAG: hypothetical protein KAR01_07895, partial [Desulfocapsa sp.]|nr:hypothetical protein [Desulfocapsa sp.]